MAVKKKAPPKKKVTQRINPATGLTDQQEQFCREYLMPQGKDGRAFNATQAAIAAGYAPKAAAQQASRLLKNVKVQEFLGALQKPSLEKFEITQDRIMEEVAAIAFSNIMDFVTVADGQAWIDISKCTREQAAALAAFEVIELPPMKTVEDGEEVSHEVLKIKIKLWDKMSALEALMRRHNLVKPLEVNMNHKGGIRIENDELAKRVAFMLRAQMEKSKDDARAKAVEKKKGTP